MKNNEIPNRCNDRVSVIKGTLQGYLQSKPLSLHRFGISLFLRFLNTVASLVRISLVCRINISPFQVPFTGYLTFQYTLHEATDATALVDPVDVAFKKRLGLPRPSIFICIPSHHIKLCIRR